MPDIKSFGDTGLECAALARALSSATPPVSDLPASLRLPETASCWVGPEAPALIRLLPHRPEVDPASPPLLWIEAADINTTARRERLSAPVIRTPLHGSEALTRIQRLIDARLDLTRPGTLVRVYGCGVLLQGESGVGKSETALMLLERGHPLVADDAVRIQARPSGELWGSDPGPLHGQLALHGLGLLKVKRLFGTTAVTSGAVIRLIVALTAETAPADPLLGAWTTQGWLGRTLPRLALASMRPRALLIETAVRQIQARETQGDCTPQSLGEQVRELL